MVASNDICSYHGELPCIRPKSGKLRTRMGHNSTNGRSPPMHRGRPVVLVPRFHGSGMELAPSFATGAVAAGASG
jgi:hypothetical protein